MFLIFQFFNLRSEATPRYVLAPLGFLLNWNSTYYIFDDEPYIFYKPFAVQIGNIHTCVYKIEQKSYSGMLSFIYCYYIAKVSISGIRVKLVF